MNKTIIPTTFKKTKTEWLLSITFSIVGLSVLIMGIFFKIDNDKFLKTAIESTAVISNIDSYRDSDGDVNHVVDISFEVDGIKYNGTLNEWNSGMHVGGTKKIYYSPENPNNFKSGNIRLITSVFMVAGLIFFAIGSGIIFFTIKKEKKFQLLKKLGKKIEANIDDISINEKYSVNGQHPYKITCSYFDSVNNKTYVFNSENVWFDIKAVVENSKILTISVYVDQSDESKYFVDVEDFRKYYEQS